MSPGQTDHNIIMVKIFITIAISIGNIFHYLLEASLLVQGGHWEYISEYQPDVFLEESKNIQIR